MNGGSLGLSTNTGASTWDVQGEYVQTGGYLFHKFKNGLSTLTVGLDYTQTGGQVSLFASPTINSINLVNLTINGDAEFSNTTFNFDSSSISTTEHEIRFNGSSLIIGDNAMFTHINHLSSNMIFGNMYYQTAGTLTYDRTTLSG